MAASTFPFADLSDPAPPLPGDVERAAVTARAHRLVRRRRLTQGIAALTCAAAVATGTVALVGSSEGSPSRRGRVEAAAAPEPVPASLTATVSGVPPGVTLHVTLAGDGATFATSTTTGAVSLAGIPPGAYEVRWSWESGDGASAVGRLPITLDEGDNHFDL